MWIGDSMNNNEVLKEFIDIYNQTTVLGGKLIFSNKLINIQQFSLSGELQMYYQHTILEEDCYFNNRRFNLILLPLGSEFTTVEHWALQDFEEFVNQDYKIFACTDSDAIIFCDIRDSKSPVYAGRPGDSDFYKLSDSLTEFLEFYIKFTKMQQKNKFDNSLDYFKATEALIEKCISENAQETAKRFLLM